MSKKKWKKGSGTDSSIDGEQKEHKKNWREVYASVDDIKAFLADCVFLRHNVVTGRAEFRLPSNYVSDGTEWGPISDRAVNSLWAEMSEEKPTRVQDVYRVIESDFVPDYHPFRYYLEHLPPWDGQNDYILEMSVSVQVKGDVDEQLQFAGYLKKWLVGMVAGWVDDTVVNNVILVLIGEQGIYKTTWFNYLLPPELSRYFYTKSNSGRMGRDDLLTLAQYGLVCCEELDTMRPSELNQLKAAVTMPSIDELAIFKCSVEANGMSLAKDYKVVAGLGALPSTKNADGSARTPDYTKEAQYAVSSARLLAQTTGEFTRKELNGDASFRWTKDAQKQISAIVAPAESDDQEEGGEG